MPSTDESPPTEVKGKHVPWKMALIIGYSALFTLTFLINYLSLPDILPEDSGLFYANPKIISDKYPTPLTPTGRTFTIWAFIYAWQITHVLYSLSCLLRKTSEGDYLYLSPGHVHFSFYVVFMCNNVVNICWMFFFDREFLELSTVAMCLSTFTLYICGVLICIYLEKAAHKLESLASGSEIWMIRIFHLNGIAMYGSWTTLATLLNFEMVLQYKSDVVAETGAWVTLVFFTIEIVAWIVLEHFVFDKHLRYCFTPYIILLVSFAGILAQNYKPSETVPAHIVYALVLLSLVVIATVVKIVIMILKGQKRPIEHSDGA